ncbi:MAG: hypothetical protein HN411_00925 [Waddliaceae bacterium]|jgi:uncharacterized protein YjeT (DUF2065 family)|nr:hypothetical protein [Waddliaceae bacterium]MBT4445193.1 hypothetical protein [Waddliaceae bacterium]MBT6928673.1 hypothetical protein [Waddliaceae bacterium]MBT7264711.1 hypothetical protein [Waddliaceae bacterium]MBT7461799.1 hypothetical protein [Waddliaceae bacterium]
MTLLIKILGLLIVASGFVYIFSPHYLKKMVDFWIEGKRRYIAAVINVIIGILLFMAASGATIPSVIYLFAIVGLLKGFMVFAISHQSFKALITYWSEKPANFIRFMGILALALGLLLIYSA